MTTGLHRIAAGMFSAPLWRPLLAGRHSPSLSERAETVRSALRKKELSNYDLIHAAYKLMRLGYRSEYFYKNLITSNLFVGRHRAANSALIHELRVGSSIADSVLINGHGTVYEVKTAYDDPSKLAGQLENYYQAFPRVNVVVPSEVAPLYSRLISNTPAGLIQVGRRECLSVVRASEPMYEALSRDVIYRMMRQAEVEHVIQKNFDEVPDVPNGLRFETYFQALEDLSTLQLQKEMQDQLKRRAPRHSKELLRRPDLKPLRSLLVQLDPTRAQQQNLNRWLVQKEGAA